jgi:hypothetical protein
MRRAISATVIGTAMVVLAAIGAAQSGRPPQPSEGRPPRPFEGRPPRPFDLRGEDPWRFGLEAPTERHEFTFARAAYSGMSWGWGRGGGSWRTDYPKADRQFLIGVQRLTRIDAYGREYAVRLDDPELLGYPFLYAVEVGRMALTEEEVLGLRRYLNSGGFLLVDDFWGSWEWDVFETEIRRVLPDRPIVDLPIDHPVFHTVYQIDEVLQVPNVRNGMMGGPYWEQDGYVPFCRGISDEDGRLVVMINWNSDLGDAWEWAENPYYPLDRSTFAYQLGINAIVYAMTY